MPPAFFLVLLLGIAVVGTLAYLSWQADKKRRALLQNLALAHGWTYAASDDSWCARLRGEPFGTGDSPKARNVLTGRYGDRDMVAFDYSYETSSTDSKGNRSTTTHRYAVCALRLPGWVSGLELTPESFGTRFAGALGFGDVQLESEQFNRRYRVKARNAKLAYDVLHPRTMQALLDRPALNLRLQDADAVCWKTGSLEPAALLQGLSTLRLVVDGVPSFVWSDTTSGGATA